jgi:hypothetical protein
MKRIALIIISLNILLSCGAERLHQRAVNKGYVHTIEVDTIKVPYLVVKNIKGKDSLIYRDSIVPKLVDKYIPKWKVRFDNKRFNDSLKYIRKVYRDSLKAEIKMHDDNLEAKIKMHDDSLKAEIKIEKQNTKQSKKPNIWLFVIGFLLGLITHFLFKFSKFNL